ncbi:flagellar type III secretion system pore protein FliP [Haloimpatiens massiliensis]|uniref:flagellar type III secretion system pore protein FliP n=1 Tax=Haloimpatiens massiliensis TaxID=1658110 RepID=UPI000C84B8F0|nr:flagellar type III secretion system pore protein FliP [Haloimpatiens massiliensis]
MKKNTKIITFVILFITCLWIFSGSRAYAASNTNIPVPKVNFSVDGADTPKEYVDNIKILIMFTILTLLPSFIIMMTSFVRIVVVFSFLKSALGAQQSIPSQVIIGLALFLTVFIMAPTVGKINSEAIQPYLKGSITQQEAMDKGTKPLKDFMLKQTRKKDLQLFKETAKIDEKVELKDLPLHAIIPAFTISELKRAFEIGFLLYIPFLIIDLVVASILMSMGMFMLPPVMISMPFKLLLFVMVDGWYLIVKSLILSFR